MLSGFIVHDSGAAGAFFPFAFEASPRPSWNNLLGDRAGKTNPVDQSI